MLTLYSKETTSFSTLGIGVLRDFISHPLITEELNGAYTLEFEYAKDGYLSEYLIEQNIIKANGQAFRIWNIKKDMQKITVFAKHIFFDLSFNFLADVFPTNLTAQSALAWLLNHAAVSTNFTATGNCTQTASTRYVRKNFIDAVFNEDNALLKKFGGELSYDNFNITVYEHRGTNANFSIRYKKNLTGIDFNLDFSNVATRIVPIGFDGLTIDSTYVESPRASNYFTPLYKTYEFNDIKYDPDDEEAYHTLSEAKQALINAANDLFTKNVDLPQVSISVNFVELSKCSEYTSYSNLETVHLGDTIDVIIPELNIHTSARVNKTVYDCILGRFITLEIGSAKQSITRSQIVIENQIRKSENYLTQAQQNAENLINHPFNGNVYIDKENGVIYLMDSTSPATAQNVWKWSLGGLGFSSTGINGTYTVAILQDGRINADFITTGQLNTGVIQGYDSLLIQVDTLDREFQKEINPTSTASGSSIHLEDSAETELIDFEVEGKTEQDGEPTPDNPSELVSVGYENLFDSENWYNTLHNLNNESMTKEVVDGIEYYKFRPNGIYNHQYMLGKFKENTQYTLSCKVRQYEYQARNTTGFMFYYTDGTSSGTLINQTITEYDYKITSQAGKTVSYIRLSYYNNDYQLVRNIQLVEGTQAHSYIPYGKYGIEVKTTGKNLIPFTNQDFTLNGLRYYVKNGNLYISGTSTGETYSTNNAFKTNFAFRLKKGTYHFYRNSSSYPSYLDNLDEGGHLATNDATFTLTKDTNVNLGFYMYQVSVSDVMIPVQLEIGNIKTTYEEHKSNAYLYTLDQPLRSIGDTKDLLYIKNGMLYAERKIGKVVLDGSENWTGYTTLDNDDTIWLQLLSKLNNALTINALNNTKLMSNYFSTYNVYSNTNTKPGICYHTDKKIQIRFPRDLLTGDTSSLANRIVSFKTWLSTHNTEAQYILAEPYTEELGEVQIPSTYKGITYINTTDELEPNMNITYVRDTLIANYVESHVSELKINEQGIEARVQTIEESDYGSRIEAVEERTTSTEKNIEIISTNIDTETGEIREVTTTNGITLNKDGLNLHVGQNEFNTQITNEATEYRDGNALLNKTSRNGSLLTMLRLLEQLLYSYNGKDTTDPMNTENYDFVDERVEADGEYCYATFYNGEE